MTEQVRAIIADDEPELRRYLKARLAEVWPELVICGEAANGLEAVELLEKHRPEAAFLDIRMPGLSGLEAARQAKGAWVVFITAYDSHAVEAFETEAVDYLVKPVTESRLIKTVERLKERIGRDRKPATAEAEVIERLLAAVSGRESSEYLRWVRAGLGDGVRLISVDEVCYFASRDKYTAVMTKDGESLIRKTIKELAEELDPEVFWNVHRGAIVNVRCIEKVTRRVDGGGIIKLKNRPETLKVSRSGMRHFRQM